MSSVPIPRFSTDRLRIRPLTIDDAAGIHAYASNPAVARYTLWEPHETMDDSRAFITGYSAQRYMLGEWEPLGLTLKDDPDQTVIGTVGIYWKDRSAGIMELGYAMAEAYWGRGLMVEACRAVLAEAGSWYMVRRVQARVMVGNHASERVLQKLCFQREGVLRRAVLKAGESLNVIMYSLTADDCPELFPTELT